MYLTSFIHREELLRIAERWFWGRPEASDALRLSRIFVADGYVLGESLESLIDRVLAKFHPGGWEKRRIREKGELRDALCRTSRKVSPRVARLFDSYLKNPEYFYYQTPINGGICLDGSGQVVAAYRLKRPKRIAEKANRRIANWIFDTVLKEARAMAGKRAKESGVPLEMLHTPEPEMVREFITAEERIAQSFRDGTISFDRSALTINDVGGIKIFGEEEELAKIIASLRNDPSIAVRETENFYGNYQATNLLLEISWDAEDVCRKYRDSASWKKYTSRGIPEAELKRGLEGLLSGCEPRITIELILSTFDALVESELGSSMHEERIFAQRENKVYRGYIPMNVEFLLEYLFAVGFSPTVTIESVPIKLWGRYLPDTLRMYIRELYHLPQYELFY